VEIDGGGHNRKDYIEYDKRRINYLESLGLKVVRFWSNEVLKNTEEVLVSIAKILKEALTPTQRGHFVP